MRSRRAYSPCLRRDCEAASDARLSHRLDSSRLRASTSDRQAASKANLESLFPQVEWGLQSKAVELRRRLGIARADGFVLCSERAGRIWRQEVRAESWGLNGCPAQAAP